MRICVMTMGDIERRLGTGFGRFDCIVLSRCQPSPGTPGRRTPVSYFEGLETTPGQPYDLCSAVAFILPVGIFVAPGDLTYKDKGRQGCFTPPRRSRRVRGMPSIIAVEQPWGIEIRSEDAEHVGPVLKPEHPWEEMGVNFYQVIKDGDLYRGWGRSQGADGAEFRSYYESRDAIHWERPELGLVEYQGSKANNLLPEPSPTSVFYRSVRAARGTL